MKCFMLATLVLLCANFAWGAGYQLRYQGAESMGTAFASAGSYGQSLSSVYYNPGLFLMQDKKRALSGEFMIIYPTESEFTSSTGTSYDDFTSTGTAGGFFYGYRIDDDSAFTLAITNPWGTNTDYESTWEGRYHALQTDLVTINIQTMLTKALSDKFILSVGPQIQQMEGQLSSATRLGGPINADLISDFEGSNLSVGAVLAMTYKSSENTTFALNYTSRVKHQLRGDLKFSPDAVATAAGQTNSDKASAEIVTPDVLTLSASHTLSEKLIGHFSASYTNWSVFKELVLKNNGTAVSTVPQNWEDSYFVSLGATHKMKENLTLRYGASYETSAVDNEDRTPRTQDADRVGLGFGASFPVGNTTFDLGLSHIIYTGDISLDIPTETTPPISSKPGISGAYENTATLLRLGVEYVF